MKAVILTIDFIVLAIYLVLAFSTYIFFKKNENEKLENIKENMLTRVKYMNILTIIIAILAIVTIVLKAYGIV